MSVDPAYSTTLATGPTPVDNNPTPMETGFKIFSSYLGGQVKKQESDSRDQIDYMKIALQTGGAYVDQSGKVNTVPWEKSKVGSDITQNAQKAGYETPYYQAKTAEAYASANSKNAMAQAMMQSQAKPGGKAMFDGKAFVDRLKSAGYKASDPNVSNAIDGVLEQNGIHGMQAKAQKTLMLSMLEEK